MSNKKLKYHAQLAGYYFRNQKRNKNKITLTFKITKAANSNP